MNLWGSFVRGFEMNSKTVMQLRVLRRFGEIVGVEEVFQVTAGASQR